MARGMNPKLPPAPQARQAFAEAMTMGNWTKARQMWRLQRSHGPPVRKKCVEIFSVATDARFRGGDRPQKTFTSHSWRTLHSHRLAARRTQSCALSALGCSIAAEIKYAKADLWPIAPWRANRRP